MQSMLLNYKCSGDASVMVDTLHFTAKKQPKSSLDHTGYDIGAQYFILLLLIFFYLILFYVFIFILIYIIFLFLFIFLSTVVDYLL